MANELVFNNIALLIRDDCNAYPIDHTDVETVQIELAGDVLYAFEGMRGFFVE